MQKRLPRQRRRGQRLPRGPRQQHAPLRRGRRAAVQTPSTLAAAPPTAGLSSVVAYYSGSLTVGDGLALGAMDGGAGDVVLGHETLYNGDLVVAADSSIFGFMLDEGDNTAFVVGLADTVPGGSERPRGLQTCGHNPLLQ